MNISSKLYGLLLFAYPAEFRREFGGQMRQTFRDCSRAEASKGSLPSFWLRTLLDLISTAATERFESSGRRAVMNNRRTDATAVLGCVGIILIGLMLHRYAVRNQVASILFFGFILDALVTTGVVGNLIIFLLVKTTKLNPLRTAIITFAIVHVLCLLLILVISRGDSGFNLNPVLFGYAVSFLFWTGVHWAWRLRAGNQSVHGS